MKVWWVLAWDKYYPAGALGNVDSCWETEEEAMARAKEMRLEGTLNSNNYVYDHIQIEDVSERLGI